jgi:transcriptional regulator with XRE-family HTH domain
MTTSLQALGERIRMLRLAKKLTQENLAEMLGLTATSYSKIEQGKSDISITRLQNIAEKLETDASELLKNGHSDFFVNCNAANPNKEVNSSQLNAHHPEHEIIILKSLVVDILKRLEQKGI